MSMLVWQPLAKLGTEFASDGYIWADPEQAFSSHTKGYVGSVRTFTRTVDSFESVDCRDVLAEMWISHRGTCCDSSKTQIPIDAWPKSES